MKRTLLFFCLFIFFIFTCFNRYTPITLQEAKPTLMQVEIKGGHSKSGCLYFKAKQLYFKSNSNERRPIRKQ